MNLQHRFFLIDCGEGTQFQLLKYKINLQKIERVLITHLHGDHFYGLIGLVSSMGLLGRQYPLHIHGPRGLDEILTSHFRWGKAYPNFELCFHQNEGDDLHTVFEDEQLAIDLFPLQHRVKCHGFLLREKFTNRKIVPEKLPPGLPHQLIRELVAGKDITFEGHVFANQDLTLPPRKARSYAYCSDTAWVPRTADYVKKADLLYHEATFIDEDQEQAVAKAHSTATEAAKVALKAGAGKLIIGHFSSRYRTTEQLLQEAQAVFPDTVLAKEGEIFGIPAG